MRNDGRRRWGGILFGTSLFVLFSGLTLPAEDRLERFEFLQIRMGIPVNIVVYAQDRPTANEAADAAYARIREIDRTMSDYDPDSELMRLCESTEPSRPVPVSDDLWTVLVESQSLWKESDGAFDVTVGPLVKLWRTARRRQQLPPPESVREAKNLVGFRHVALNPDGKTVSLAIPGMRLDLGGIAKGYAADAAIEVLKRRGVTRALVEAGGDITVADPPPGRAGWRIELERLPADRTGKPVVLSLKNAAVATSGDAYQYLEVDGVRYSHLIDPKTGLGLTTPGSATVIAVNGTLADGLASAVSILGPDRGRELALKYQAEALILTLLPDGTVSRAPTPRFSTHLTP